MKSFRILVASMLCAIVAACSTMGTTPQQSIYQLTANYNAGASIVLAYKGLPACAPGQPGQLPVRRCSNTEVMGKLRHADEVAYQALVAAEKTVRTPGAGANADTALIAAQNAIQALNAIAATLQVK